MQYLVVRRIQRGGQTRVAESGQRVAAMANEGRLFLLRTMGSYLMPSCFGRILQHDAL